jgi:hypothetical protein
MRVICGFVLFIFVQKLKKTGYFYKIISALIPKWRLRPFKHIKLPLFVENSECLQSLQSSLSRGGKFEK